VRPVPGSLSLYPPTEKIPKISNLSIEASKRKAGGMNCACHRVRVRVGHLTELRSELRGLRGLGLGVKLYACNRNEPFKVGKVPGQIGRPIS